MSDDNTRRHWHGSPGDRHQHLNVWMNGGAKSPSGRAAWAMPDTRRVSYSPLSILVPFPYILIIPLALHHYITTPLDHYIITHPSIHLLSIPYLQNKPNTPK
jgi:hypothetical protein